MKIQSLPTINQRYNVLVTPLQSHLKLDALSSPSCTDSWLPLSMHF